MCVVLCNYSISTFLLCLPSTVIIQLYSTSNTQVELLFETWVHLPWVILLLHLLKCVAVMFVFMDFVFFCVICYTDCTCGLEKVILSENIKSTVCLFSVRI